MRKSVQKEDNEIERLQKAPDLRMKFFSQWGGKKKKKAKENERSIGTVQNGTA